MSMLQKCLSMVKNSRLTPQIHSVLRRQFNIARYEPPYLESMKPKFPAYEAVTVQIKGYDFPLLENFQKFAHSIAEYLDMTVELCWAHPAAHYEIHTFKPRSSVVEETYKLLVYERNIKLVNVISFKLSLLIELLQSGMPEGTTLKVFLYSLEHENEKYVPDHDLIAKMKELDELGGPIIDENDNPFYQTPK